MKYLFVVGGGGVVLNAELLSFPQNWKIVLRIITNYSIPD